MASVAFCNNHMHRFDGALHCASNLGFEATFGWVLGEQYMLRSVAGEELSEGAKEMRERVGSLFRFTYRRGFVPIPGSSPPTTTDAGWGCMLRTGQMMLAQAFRLHYCQGIVEPGLPESILDETAYRIASWFCDRPESPYSVHNIAMFGVCKGKPVGSWFGPTTTALVLQELVALHAPCLHHNSLRVCVAEHATLFKDQIRAVDGEWRSLILLVPVMLGASTYANPVYMKSLLQCFHLPGFLGVVGGRPQSSLYFIGYVGDDRTHKLLYLDPHVAVQPALLHAEMGGPIDGLASLREESAKMLDLSLLDPSLLLGFYCRTERDFEMLAAVTKVMFEDTEAPLFCWQDHNTLASITTSADRSFESAISDNSEEDFQLVEV